jgi:hypothetical protein
VTSSSRLPPRASEAVALAREDLARRKGISVTEVETLAMKPGWAQGWDFPRKAYDIALGARGEYVSYLAAIEPVIQLREPVTLPGRPAGSENDILHAANGTWEVTDAALVLDNRRERAYVVTTGSASAEVDLKRMRVRYRPHRAAIGEYFLDHFHPALTGGKVFLGATRIFPGRSEDRFLILDLPTGRVADISNLGHDLYSGGIEPAGSRVFFYSAREGVSLLNPSGLARYTILDDGSVARVQVRGPRAYVTLSRHQEPARTAVVDVASGRVLRVAPFSTPVELLVGRQTPPY